MGSNLTIEADTSQGFRADTHLPIDNQPLNHLYSHSASYITAYHTYFTGCETKNTAHAGFTKGNVNTHLSLIYQSNRRCFSTNNEPLLRVSFSSLSPKSKTTSNYQILIFRKISLSVFNSGNYTYAVVCCVMYF